MFSSRLSVATDLDFFKEEKYNQQSNRCNRRECHGHLPGQLHGLLNCGGPYDRFQDQDQKKKVNKDNVEVESAVHSGVGKFEGGL